jgi:hypothetical protein
MLWTEENKYLFDLNGYLVLENYFPLAIISRMRATLKYLESLEEYPYPVVQGKLRTAQELYLSNIAEYDDDFESLICDPGILEIIEKTTMGYYRFNHSYSISHWAGGSTHLHMGGYPIHPKALYQVKNGDIFSSLTKAVIPLDNHNVEDGCFCVVPGSHKANFDNKYNLGSPSDHPAIKPLPAKPGDLIIFTEALQHGGLNNISNNIRRTIYYCYSVGSMPDWGSLGLHCSDALYKSENEQLRETVRLKVGAR